MKRTAIRNRAIMKLDVWMKASIKLAAPDLSTRLGLRVRTPSGRPITHDFGGAPKEGMGEGTQPTAMLIGTAGHVDHGKTALVKALTGVDADRLAEEKRRGITIDLGYAYAGALGFIDVPGHEKLVHTMLAGAGGIDAALLVVAVDDGVMPQTQEHAQILDLLGIDRGVVAISKTDLAPDRVPEVASGVRALLQGTALRDAPIVAVSARTGDGVAGLQAVLDAIGARPRDTEGYPRLAVDRAFTLTGVGLVVTGTLVSGRIAVDDRLVLSPSGLALRVRALHAQNRPAEQAEAGQRVALNIAGPRLSKAAVARGDWVLHEDVHAPTAVLDARIRLLDGAAAPRPDTTVHVHLAAAHVTARIAPLDPERLAPGASALVRLTLSAPVGALAGDRIVLRDAAARHTIGGGLVVDPYPPARGRRTPARLAQLAALERRDPAAALRDLLALPPGWTDRTAFFRARNMRPTAQEAAMAAAPAVALAGLALAPRLGWEDRIAGALASHHRAHPDEPGLPAARLRPMLDGRPPEAAFAALIEAMLRARTIAQDGPWLRLASHRAVLSPQDEKVWREAGVLIAADRFRPPRTRDLARALAMPEPVTRASLKRLQRMGRLVEIAPDHFFLRETVAEMAALAGTLAEAEGEVTAAAFRDRLDNGRKVAIQILEFFDRNGLTIRKGDQRRVRRDRLRLFGDPP
jgi:selenocysteine-specific elongation factor